MSEEVVLVLGVLFAVGIVGYLLAGEAILGNTLSASDIAQYAGNAGFSGDDLVTAVAIALAESSGNASATGDKTTGARSFGGRNLPVGAATSYGLWQIHWTVHPEVLNGADPSILFDPQVNANAAFTVFREQGFEAWSTFGNQPGHNNAYASYLGAASAAVSA
jgi:Lysozyme like domain